MVCNQIVMVTIIMCRSTWTMVPWSIAKQPQMKIVIIISHTGPPTVLLDMVHIETNTDRNECCHAGDSTRECFHGVMNQNGKHEKEMTAMLLIIRKK